MAAFLRKFFFWLHLVAGCVAGVVILVMATTGVLISFERQVLDRANAGLRAAPPPGTARLPLSALLPKAQESEGGAAPTSVTWRAEATAPLAVSFGRERTVFFNPYTGAALGEGAKSLDTFFYTVTEVHRWLALSGDKRELGKGITGAAALVFLFLVLSGIYLWWPRQWRWKAVKAIVLFDGRLKGRTRDWNWHNVFGFWACLPLLITTLTGLVMSYTWANNLLFRLTGNEPPPPRAAGPRPGGPSPADGARPGGENRAREGGPRRGEGGRGPTDFQNLDRLALRAEQYSAHWQTITARLPATFVVEQSHRGRPDKKVTLTFDTKTGKIANTETFASQNLGRQLRVWVRWVHTGEAAGLAGQVVAALTAAAAAMLVWTGLALGLRRFGNWRRRRTGRSTIKTATDNRPLADSTVLTP
jgi:uncharacterized iron-regulated membrane protein